MTIEFNLNTKIFKLKSLVKPDLANVIVLKTGLLIFSNYSSLLHRHYDAYYKNDNKFSINILIVDKIIKAIDLVKSGLLLIFTEENNNNDLYNHDDDTEEMVYPKYITLYSILSKNLGELLKK